MNKIEILKEITLSIQAGASQEAMNLKPKYRKFEFIFGLGSKGLTPFEFELGDKVEGDSIVFHQKKEDVYSFFEHLNLPIMDLFEDRPEVYLKVTIEAVRSADNRKIIKAMAAMAAHGGCGCDCGCGG
jgi:hypothetical protein